MVKTTKQLLIELRPIFKQVHGQYVKTEQLMNTFSRTLANNFSEEQYNEVIKDVKSTQDFIYQLHNAGYDEEQYGCKSCLNRHWRL